MTINKIKIILLIGWRNIFRNKRRTSITCGAIIFGVAVLIHLNGFNKGFTEQMIRNVIDLQTGHIQITQKDFYKNFDIKKRISNPDEIINKILKINNSIKIAGISKRVRFRALISSPENSSGIMILGVSPKEEKKVSVLFKTILKGEFLQDTDNNSILIGEDIANSLSVNIGEKVVILIQDSNGPMSAKALKIRGIFKTGIPTIDKSVGYIPIETAKNLIGYNKEASEIVVLLENSKYLDKSYNSINLILNNNNLKVWTWRDLASDMVEMIQINNVYIYIVMVIVFALVALGILNTMNMSIFERFKELGIITAIGMKSKEILLMIISEAFFLSIIGGFIGVILGLTDVWLLHTYGFNFAEHSSGVNQFLGLNTVIYSVFTWEGVLIPLLFAFTISIITSLYPAIKATRLEIVDIIRHI